MKFLIQTTNGIVRHDFSFVLIESIEYQNWYSSNNKLHEYKLTNDDKPHGYIPVGSNTFVIEYLQKHFNKTPLPINIPDELNTLEFTHRNIIKGTKKDITGSKFIKSTDKIKGYTDLVYDGYLSGIPEGNYLISDFIEIDSEWRAFVYKDKMVGLNNYSGEFTIFPDVSKIQKMIDTFKNKPIAFTLDVGINKTGTFIIEIHDFFSCGLYGFADHRILPNMIGGWFNEYVNGTR